MIGQKLFGGLPNLYFTLTSFLLTYSYISRRSDTIFGRFRVLRFVELQRFVLDDFGVPNILGLLCHSVLLWLIRQAKTGSLSFYREDLNQLLRANFSLRLLELSAAPRPE